MAKITITGIVVNESNYRQETSPKGNNLKLKDIIVKSQKFDVETGQPKQPNYYQVTTWDNDNPLLDKKVKIDAWVTTSIDQDQQAALTIIKSLQLELV